MENKAHAMAAGIFVVVVAALLVMLAAWLTRDTGERDTYEISTREPVTGLQSQAAVRYRGVEVGKVGAIGFDPKATGNVLIRIEVDREAPVTTDTFATLSYQGVTGLAFVQLDDHGRPGSRLAVQGGQPPRIPLEPGLVAKLTARGEVVLDQVQQFVTRANLLLGETNQRRFATSLDNLGQAAADASQLARKLQATVDQRLDPALAETTQSMRSVRNVADEFGRTAKRLNEPDGPIDRLAQGSQSLSHAADAFNAATLPRINRVTDDASRAMRQLGRTANSIGENPQSLLYGTGHVAPGPGEPGFTPPKAAPQQ
ncbi:MlaD family protein [Ramlibacter solisilvae]|uniref:Mammalian cell entry protein n=1 Tax=Ramlibacter tataouinensis TaxID=94132 RepID=A0A127JY51_9BURK|nr:MlaD family protein [Ramlibacter tataouinensis]AMO23002.1 mammalian cell entry protein [Ramlibacter tataouinensis]